MSKRFNPVNSKIDFIKLEHDIISFWDKNNIFNKLRKKNNNGERWSFLDGPITANNPMGVHHAWGRTLKDVFQRYHSMKGKCLRYQNGFDCQGLWVEIEVEKEMGFKTKREVQNYGLEKFVNRCKERVEKYSEIQTNQSKRLGYWMDWENSYYTMSDENNYTIWAFLKKLYQDGKIYKGTDVVPWSGRSGTSYSQMEIIEGRKLVAHTSLFVKFPLLDRHNEYILIWTTTPWTLTANVAAAINVNLNYVKLKAYDGSIYYFAEDNLKFKRLDRQFNDKKQWIKGVPKLKSIAQIFKEKGGYEIIDVIKGSEMLGWKYIGPFDELEAQNNLGGYPYISDNKDIKNKTSIDCHYIIDGGKDNIGNDIVVAGEGTGIVHTAPGCGAIDNKIAIKEKIVSIAPLDDESCYIDGFGKYKGYCATDKSTTEMIINDLKEKKLLIYQEKYPHVYPHCWRSGDELVFRIVDEWYINMDWRDSIKKIVNDINWIPSWGREREMEWLNNMGDWMISKKRFWGLALPIWTFEDGTFFVVGSKEELKELAVEGWQEFEGNSPHRPWIDKIKIKHPDTGLIGERIPDVGNPWLDAGIVPYSTIHYNSDREYWKKWFPADFVVECFPGQFRNWFYSLLALSTTMTKKAPFKTLLGHALVKDETGRDMHKSWGNAIWFDDAADKMGVDVMRWMYCSQNPEHNLLFGYSVADEMRKQILTLWNTYSFFVTYANLDDYNPSDKINYNDLRKSDKWILSKINNFIKISEKYYEKYQLYFLLSEASKLLDDLSNWYVRRNRRRFWKSENDSDKSSAYFTLYTVIIQFVKVMAPIIPFICDEIYRNLSKSIKSSKESIHLCDYPIFEKSLINTSIQDEVDTLIEIVSLTRSARNKANIKIRQPLSTLYIYADKLTMDVAKTNQKEILDELNIKELILVDNISKIIKYSIKCNFQIIGQKYGSIANDINKELMSMDVDYIVKLVKSNKNIKLEINNDIIEILPEEIIITETGNEGQQIISNNNLAISIDTTITQELKNEGLIRDLIRQIQNLRKDSGFKVQDRINIFIEGHNELKIALKSHKSYFMNEVLGVRLNLESQKSEFVNSIKIDGHLTKIGIDLAN